MNGKMMKLFDKKDKLEDKLDKITCKIMAQIEIVSNLEDIEDEMGIACDDFISDLFYDEILDRIVVISNNTDVSKFCYINAQTLEILPKSDDEDKSTLLDTIKYLEMVLKNNLKNKGE